MELRRIYLDWNATTPLACEVVAAMTDAQAWAWGNPASVHTAGREARAVLEGCRDTAARCLGVHPREVYFTSGGTEANNLALWAVPALITSRMEHPSVARVAELIERDGRSVQWLSVSETGAVEAEEVRRRLRDAPHGTTVAIAAVNHVTGVLQPIQEIIAVAAEFDARVHVDAVQSVGKVAPELYRGANSTAVASHKIRGPKGIGLLIWRGRPPLPVLRGGAQERGVRPGTQDAVLAAGFKVALERSALGPERYAALAPLRDSIEARLRELASVNGSARRAPHVSNLAVSGWSADELIAALDLEGVLASSGSACSAGTAEPSPVITAMWDEARARCSVRLSLGETTTLEDVELATTRIERVLARHMQPSRKA